MTITAARHHMGAVDPESSSPWRGIRWELSDPWYIGSSLNPTFHVTDEITISMGVVLIADRITYWYSVEDNALAPNHVVHNGADLTAPEPINLDRAAESLLAFLGNYGEIYQRTMSHGSVDELESLPAHYEWCYLYSDELASAQLTFIGEENL